LKIIFRRDILKKNPSPLLLPGERDEGDLLVIVN
jgi:hypothetical protein